MATSHTTLGSRGARFAVTFLQENSYQTLGTNYRCPWGELDIIATEGDEIVFADVRTRRGTKYGGSEESLIEAKVQHLIGASQIFLQTHDLQTCDRRIDLV